MKFLKFFFLFLSLSSLFLVASCGDDSDDYVSYTVKTEDIGSGSSVSKGIDLNFVLFEYNKAGEKIGTNSWYSVSSNTTRKFNGAPGTEKVKVYYKLTSGSYSKSSWVQTVFYVKSGPITITSHTMVGPNEP